MSVEVDDYGWRTHEAACSAGYVTPYVVATLRAIRARRVLDLGCGNGALCGELARAGHEVVGTDYDAAGVEIARARNPCVRFHRLGVADDPADLLAREAPFDAVVSTEVIEHLHAPHLLPRFAAAVLRPSGRLIVTTPYHGYAKNLALSVFDRWDHHHTALWHGGHVKFFSRRTLAALLEANGFEVEAFTGLGRLPWLWRSMGMLARRRAATERSADVALPDALLVRRGSSPQ
jgi:2-polyprenyl-3-methyl-5-hydroxy-6-metoxy-1,4-benzoquinol methylase